MTIIKAMKTILYIYLLFFSTLTGYAKGWGSPNFKVLDVSFLNIHGKTNVNSFVFYFNNSSESPSNADIQPLTGTIRSARINIPVKRLYTNNEYMYSDFLALLKEPEYPEISIGIDERSLRVENDEKTLFPIVAITIAGVTNLYRIQCNIEDNNVSNMMIKGGAQIKLTDFDLEPPTKMLGLVKVKNEIDINFGILLGH